MTESILDYNLLTRMAAGFASECNLAIGVYDYKGDAISPNIAFGETDITFAISKLGLSGVESIVDLSTSESRVSAIAMRKNDGSLLALWLVMANPSDTVPFDKHLSLIDTVLSSYMKERDTAYTLSGSIKDQEKMGSDLTVELAQNEALTEILGKLESEDDFDKVSIDILVICGEFLNLSNIFLLQLDKENDSVQVLNEWHNSKNEALLKRLDSTSLSELPFADGLSYTVSSDSRVPDAFKTFMEAHDISAGIFLPIFLDEENIMYLCATMNTTPRHWNLSEAGFLNDARRVISSILAKRVAKNSLASSYAVVEAVLENIGCGVMVSSPEDGGVLYTNETFRGIFKNISDRQRFERQIRQTPEKMKQIREYYLENAGIYVSVTLGTINWVDDSIVRLATVFDVSDNKEFELKIEKQANIDELTGIYNRTFFVKELGRLLEKKHDPGAYICMNIDGFKDVNVSVGNESGDLLLSSIAKFLLKLSGENSKVYRLGGDEFAIIINDSKVIDPSELSKSIIRRFEAPWQIETKDCYLSASIGIARFPQDADDVVGVLRAGEVALRSARNEGVGTISLYQQEMETELREQILFRSLLSDSVKNGFVGIDLNKTAVDFISEKVIKRGEVYDLIYKDPAIGTKVYDEILPVARKMRLTDLLIKWLIDEICKECRYQNDFGYPDYHAGIIIDVCDLIKYDIMDFLETAISESGVNPDRLILVIRGNALPKQESIYDTKIGAIKRLGVNIQ